ncbi:MAG: ACP S-malonyltransferase [Bacillota bacterium]
MTKIGFIFPGQGAQYVGMGKALAEQYPLAQQLFDEADQALGFSLSSLCFEGPEEDLKQTEITQPAILTVSVIAWRLLAAEGIAPSMVAGLSLGEYSALVAANTLGFADAVQLVHKRGRYMQEAVPLGEGGMAAILGLDRQRLVEVCHQASHLGVVAPANFNCPGQIVIAGTAAAVDEAVRLAQEAGARRAVKLPVSAPFHTSLLEPAGVKLAQELKHARLSRPEVPALANVTAQPHQDEPEAIAQGLVAQVSHPVLWEDCVGTMLHAGIDTFVELGPGQSLSAFVRKISREAKVLNVEDPVSLNKTVESLRGDAV